LAAHPHRETVERAVTGLRRRDQVNRTIAGNHEGGDMISESSAHTPAVPEVLVEPLRNRGVAFAQSERDALGLTGRPPSAVVTLDEQAARWLASGPRCGLGELILPANEPGSSIMPVEVNPTQCEAMVMVCIQVLADDTAIAFAGSQGNFELNAMRPVIIANFLHAAGILADACGKLRGYCIAGTRLNRDRIGTYVTRSLMLVTALSPVIGYDKASAIAHKADAEGTTLREAALATGYVSAADFDRVVNPAAMVGQDPTGPDPK
jgi:hypothetical protein